MFNQKITIVALLFTFAFAFASTNSAYAQSHGGGSCEKTRPPVHVIHPPRIVQPPHVVIRPVYPPKEDCHKCVTPPPHVIVPPPQVIIPPPQVITPPPTCSCKHTCSCKTKIELGVVGTMTERGLIVQSVQRGSLAERADVRVGDMIYRINGINIRDRYSMQQAMSYASQSDALRILAERVDGYGRRATAELAVYLNSPQPYGGQLAENF